MPDQQTYYQTVAQVLPVLVIAGAVELRYLIRRCSQPGGAFDKGAHWSTRLVAHAYVRFLAFSTGAVLLLTISCLEGIRTGDLTNWWLDDLLPIALPFSVVALALPLLGGVLSTKGLLRWYGEGT